jgi:hypothetical protein
VASSHITDKDLPPLPPNKTAVDILADFLHYLLDCAKNYIQETHANGETLWSSMEDSIDIVLSHPNGWTGAQQNEMRRAAIIGGLVPDSPEGHKRIQFVTEGEASLHFCLGNGLARDAIKV